MKKSVAVCEVCGVCRCRRKDTGLNERFNQHRRPGHNSDRLRRLVVRSVPGTITTCEASHKRPSAARSEAPPVLDHHLVLRTRLLDAAPDVTGPAASAQSHRPRQLGSVSYRYAWIDRATVPSRRRLYPDVARHRGGADCRGGRAAGVFFDHLRIDRLTAARFFRLARRHVCQRRDAADDRLWRNSPYPMCAFRVPCAATDCGRVHDPDIWAHCLRAAGHRQCDVARADGVIGSVLPRRARIENGWRPRHTTAVR